MRRNPSLLIRRILWLWHFVHIMYIHSARLQDEGETRQLYAQLCRNVSLTGHSPLTGREGQRSPDSRIEIKASTSPCYLDAPLASLFYCNQRHAHPRRQRELLSCSAQLRADSRPAN